MIPDSDAFNWIIGPAGNCVRYVTDETIQAAVVHRSLISWAGMRPFLELARQAFEERGLSTAAFDELMQDFELTAPQAQQMVDEDFHGINAHALTGLWSAIEVTVEDTVVLILMKDPEAVSRLEAHGLGDRRFRTGPLAGDDARRLFASAERRARQNSSVGEAYVAILQALGLRVNLESDAIEGLSRVNALRNCLLHRAGIVDERTAREVPELRELVGEPIRVSSDPYKRAYGTVGVFASVLLEATTSSRYVRSAHDAE